MLLAIGRISGTHGLKGEVKVESYSGEFEHFRDLETVVLRKENLERTASIEGSKMSGGKIVLDLREVESVEEAAALRGWELFAPRQEAAPLEEGEYYIADLIGLRVTHAGEDLGVVSAVYDGAQSELIEIDLGDRRRLVPFLAVFVAAVDPEQGFLELAEPWVLE